MVPIQTTSCSTITERIDRIRMRIYLEKAFGISAADKKAFLEICQQYEQVNQTDLIDWHNDWQGEGKSLSDWSRSQDFDQYAPDK